MPTFRELLAGDKPVVAPNVFNPLTAKLAEAEGFPALYLGGGPLGYALCVTEANIALPEIVQVGIDIRTVCSLPLILDGTAGWGDPMHLHRTIGMSEAAGFCAIEIEDQVLPKRAHHHVGVEHNVPTKLMVAKIREAVAARRDPDFVIIGRTNAARNMGRDEAVRRGIAYKKAGADMLFVLPKAPEETRWLAERLPPPLMYMTLRGGMEALDMSLADMHALGYRLIVDPMTPILALHKAMRDTYRAMARGKVDPLLAKQGHKAEHEALNASIDLEKLLAIERATVER